MTIARKKSLVPISRPPRGLMIDAWQGADGAWLVSITDIGSGRTKLQHGIPATSILGLAMAQLADALLHAAPAAND